MWQGRVVAIHIHGEEGAAPFAIDEARLVAGKGIEGDVNYRQIAEEVAAQVEAAELSKVTDPGGNFT